MSHGDTSPAPVQVFYSYAHADEAHRDALREHLALLRHQGLIAEWYARDITAGDGWRQRIDDHLEAAQLILLLISPSFMHSDYCHDIEMRRALERHANGDAWVIPIHLRPVDVTGAGFGELQALPRDARPITAWDDPDRAFADVARGIRHAIQVIRGTPVHAPIVHTALTAPVGIRWKRFIGAALVLAVLMGGGYVYSQNNPQLNRQLREAEQWLHTAQYDRAKRAYREALAQSWGLSRAAKLGLEKAGVYDPRSDGIDPRVIEQRIARIESRYPNDAHVHLFRGDLQYYIHNARDQALASYQQAIDRDPSLAQAYFNMGVIYDQQGETDKALAQYQAAVDRQGNHAPYVHNLAELYDRRQDIDQALPLYKRALRLDPSYLLAYIDLANLLRARSQPDTALPYLEKAAFLIEDPQIAERPHNNTNWSIVLGQQRLPLGTLAHKRCYTHRTLAATRRVLGRQKAAADHPNKACGNLPPPDITRIEAWVQAEIEPMRQPPTQSER